jgi:2-polyprenyl-3-methyl-5-hydroxy-6-metoxy-1,4-benzoquinol methylase
MPRAGEDTIKKNITGDTRASKCPLCAGGPLDTLHTRVFQEATWHLVRCGSCNLHFTDPIPNDRQIRRFYSSDFHTDLRLPGATERHFGARFNRYVAWIQQFVASGRTLDVGCATGLLPKTLRDRGYDAEGLELNPETASWGAEHYRIPIRNGSLELLASESSCYDLISLTEVVEHTTDPAEFLTNVHRLLKPGGYALVTFPDITAPKSRYYRWLSQLTGREWVWVTCHIPLHIWEFSHSTATALFTKTGFSVAGFRRTEADGELPGKFKVLMWPMKPLNFAPLANLYGSQMEFMIRKMG